MALIFINAVREGFVLFREFMKGIFIHKKDPIKTVIGVPLTKPIPAFESPLKDSYANSSALHKEKTK